jgi:nicotinamidase-related amidase
MRDRIGDAAMPLLQRPDKSAGYNSDALICQKWNELRKAEIERPAPLLGKIILSGSLGMLYGPRGIGKSHVAQGIAYAVASGEEFLDLDAPNPGVVAYADGELTSWELQRRFKRLDASSNEPALARRNLHLIRPNFDAGVLPSLQTLDGQGEFEKAIPANTVLLVIDPLSAWCRSGRESAEVWRNTQEWALRLRARGIAVLFIHHANKRGGQRGTSMREDALDYVISLRLSAGERSNRMEFEWRYEKLRHVPHSSAGPMHVQYKKPKGKPGRWVWRPLGRSGRIKAIHELKEKGLSNAAIAKKLRVDRVTIQRDLKRAREESA